MEISVQWYSYSTKELGHSLYFFQGAGTFTLLFPRSWDSHSTFSEELGHSLYFFQGAGTFTSLFPRSWDIHFTFSKELGHSLCFFQGAGTVTLLFPRSWDIHYTFSKELGHSLYFFQGSGTFNLLLPRSWDIQSTFSTELHCKKKVSDFPVPSQDVTNQTLPGVEKSYYSRPGRVFFIDIPAGDGKIFDIFLQSGTFFHNECITTKEMLPYPKRGWERPLCTIINEGAGICDTIRAN
jgi:hypothetical protein